MITGITEITHVTTKQDMSRWTRAHADTPGITWSVIAGEGGTMIFIEHEEDRTLRTRENVAAEVTVPETFVEEHSDVLGANA